MHAKRRRNGPGSAWVLPLGLLAAAPALAVTTIDAQADLAVTAEGRVVLVDVLANDPGTTPGSALSIHTRPANGTARVVKGRLEYTPAPGFQGRDSFSYLVKGVRSLGTATVTVDVGRALVLRGKVTDGPIANAEVQASVDGHVFTTQADADGNYGLEIIGVDGGMVTLGAQGSGDQAIVNFVSIVGGFDRLASEAGDDGELSRDENNQVQVTNVSTAQAYLMEVAAGGVPITDDAALEVAREAIDNGQLLTASAAIKLAVDGGFPLPEGTTDTLALLSNPGALEGFLTEVEEQAPGALAETINEIASDPNLTVPMAADDMVGTYTLVHDLGVPGTVNTGYIQGSRMTLDAGSGGEMVGPSPNHDPSVTWSFDEASGRAVVVPNSPFVLVSYEIIDGIGQVRRFDVTSRYEVAKLFEGNGRDTLAVTTTTDYSYPDNPGIPGGSRTGTATNIGIRDGAGSWPFTTGEIAGTTRSMAISDTAYANSNYNGSELFTFAADGTGSRADGPAFDWDIDEAGRLRVVYGDGSTGAYARVSSDGRGAEGLAFDWTSANGNRSAMLQISALADGFTFDAGTAQADWMSGQSISRTAYLASDTGFHILLRAGYLGWTLSLSESGMWPVPAGWTVQGGVMDLTMYRNGSNEPVHWCQVGVDGCYINMVRRWRPVASDGNRIHVIEEFLWDIDGDGDLDVTNQRGNFYDSGIAVPFAPPRLDVPKAVARPATKPDTRSGR
ncbi:Ig-like domain-containing protein [Luteimonas arsenica]|uniref:Ig-like domain-containing protein n=1 Tax=Luteimonas arsenica TaxID=1586242 RepID=UPI001056A146|nr:Ig-like domain-containing protein [Luteimonas arsenica]